MRKASPCQHQHPGNISWAFQKPWCVDCPISQKRCLGILVTRLALYKDDQESHQEGQGMMGHWPCPQSQALAGLGAPPGEMWLGRVPDASEKGSGL